MTLDSLLALRVNAEAGLTECHERMEAVKKELTVGVSMGGARVIIEGIWGKGIDGKKLIAKLSSTFPKENSDLLRYAAMPVHIKQQLVGRPEKAVLFFQDSHEYIDRAVAAIIANLSHFDQNDTNAIDLYNNFRKNVLRYIDMIGYDSFDIDGYSIEAVNAWEEWEVSSTAVDEGDYLFMTDFLPDLQAVHKKLMTRRGSEVSIEGDSFTIGSMTYDIRTFMAEIRGTYLFVEYLCKLLPQAE